MNEFESVERFTAPTAPPPPPPRFSAALAEARARITPGTSAQELGDLFEYKIKEPITILKDHSALVPILQSKIDGEKVSVWNESAGTVRPQRALWLTNTSGLTPTAAASACWKTKLSRAKAFLNRFTLRKSASSPTLPIRRDTQRQTSQRPTTRHAHHHPERRAHPAQ